MNDCHKKPYRTQGEALLALQALWAPRGQSSGNALTGAYLCPTCRSC